MPVYGSFGRYLSPIQASNDPPLGGRVRERYERYNHLKRSAINVTGSQLDLEAKS